MKISMYGCMGRMTLRPLNNINNESTVSIDNTEKDSASVSSEVNNSKNIDIYEPSNQIKEDDLNAGSQSEKAAGSDARAEYTALLNYLREQSANNNMQLPQEVKYNPEDEKHIIRKPEDPEVVEKRRRTTILVDTINDWNNTIKKIGDKIAARNIDYFGSVKLFKKELADWERNLQINNPEAYKLWLELDELHNK